MFFNNATNMWSTTAPENPSYKVTATKVWSYRDHNQNRLYRWENGEWIPADNEDASGLERGFDYTAAPREKDGALFWVITGLARIASDDLIEMGINEKFLLRGGSAFQQEKPDYIWNLSENTYRQFKERVEAIGGRITPLTVSMDEVEQLSTELEQERETLIRIVQEAANAAHQPYEAMDTEFFTYLDGITQQARIATRNHETNRKRLERLDNQLYAEPERSADKARLKTIAAKNPPMDTWVTVRRIIEGINRNKGIFEAGKEPITPDRHALNGLLLGLYGNHHSIIMTDSGMIRIRLDQDTCLELGEKITLVSA